jgi:hypothetical protein
VLTLPRRWTTTLKISPLIGWKIQTSFFFNLLSRTKFFHCPHRMYPCLFGLIWSLGCHFFLHPGRSSVMIWVFFGKYSTA